MTLPSSTVGLLRAGSDGQSDGGEPRRAGHDIVVYNRTFSVAEEWVARNGGRAASTPAEAASGRMSS